MMHTAILCKAKESEIDEDWVWLSDPKGLYRKVEFVKIKHKANGKNKSIVVRKRLVDENYIRHHGCFDGISSDLRKLIEDSVKGETKDTTVIFMNSWYRTKLGIDYMGNGSEINLCIRPVRYLGELRSFRNHPDPYVRLGVKLGILSLSISFVSVLIAISPLIVHFIVH